MSTLQTIVSIFMGIIFLKIKRFDHMLLKPRTV